VSALKKKPVPVLAATAATAPAVEPESDITPERVAPLREAERLITRDRNNTYGPPTQDFDRTARFWTTYLDTKLKPGAAIEMHDVALMIDLLKTSRLVWAPGQFDSWADKAGYVGCGWECAVEEEKEKAKAAARTAMAKAKMDNEGAGAGDN
jgi:hypothetical protein